MGICECNFIRFTFIRSILISELACILLFFSASLFLLVVFSQPKIENSQQKVENSQPKVESRSYETRYFNERGGEFCKRNELSMREECREGH